MSKTTEALAKTINLAGLIPAPPADWFQQAQEAGFANNKYLIYRSNGKLDKKQGRRKLTGVCTACGKKMSLPFEVEKHYQGTCPKCLRTAYIRDWAESKYGAAKAKAGLLVFNKVENLIVCVGYAVNWALNREGKESHTITAMDIYIFGLAKPLHFGGWEQWGMGPKYKIDGWYLKSRVNDSWMMQRNLIYPFEESLLAGTCLENSKVVQYLNTTHDCCLAKYCEQYLLYPGIENLVTQGYIKYVQKKLYGYASAGAAINWREKAPRKMLGLNRQEEKRAIAENWSTDDLFAYKWCRDKQIEASREEIQQVFKIGTKRFEKTALEYMGSIPKFFQYFQKQGKYAKRSYDKQINHAFGDWHDYRQIGTELGYDMQDPKILFPPKLKAAHDRAVAAKQYIASEALRQRFAEAYEQVKPLEWAHGDFIIRPAQKEEDLIKEGKKLSHCVGGYGRAHCSGEPIFFIRKAEAPETPYFTLQLMVKGKYVIQNRGKGNCPPPEEVKEFVKQWMETVVQMYDFAKKRFKRPKKTTAV
ncbi:MAG: PcfJ domain-containing protein [Oscillospiraceae bacterium]